MKHAFFRPTLTTIAATGLLAASAAWAQQTAWIVFSPDNTVRTIVQFSDLGGQAGYPAGTRLYYNVSIGGPGFTEVVPAAPLGITRADQSFVDGLVYDSISAPVTIDETYTLVTGKRRVIRNNAIERSLHFHNASGARLTVVVRAYNDGIAFRYVFPETSAGTYTVTGETTGFRVPASSTAWMLPHQTPGTYEPAYEDTYRQVTSGASSPNSEGWSLPALFKTPGGQYALIGETEVTPNYAGTRLQQAAPSSVYRIRLPSAAEGNNTGAVNPAWTLPWAMPWRFVIVGAHPGVILESHMATNLASPSKITDVSWIRPGRASWSWYSNEASPKTYSQMLPFINLAQQMTWEYHLVDTEWSLMTGGTWQSIVSYGNARNVGTLLWYNGGGPHNTLTSGFNPRDRLWDSALRQTEFQAISQGGVKGIKVDFFQSDKQNMIKYYHDLMRDAAKYNLLINFHGCTIQRGWQRTWPHLMTTESVRGAEMYKYDAAYPAQQPARNTILPFTRNVMGGMDYTPVTFNQYNNQHLTTHAHELALSVVFESGIQHFADAVAGYNNRPDSVKAFLRGVPSVWDETRYLQGEPGTHVVIARRKGNDWWIGGVTSQAATRTFTQPLAFLGSGSYALLQLADGASNTTFTESARNVGPQDTITAAARSSGGFAARLVRLDPVSVAPRRPSVPAGIFPVEYYDAAGRRLTPVHRAQDKAAELYRKRR